MGVNVARVRILTFVFMGLGAALAGVFSTMVNYTWWPTTGDGYLLPAIASVFVGGTPTWGGVGTIAGGAIGALTVSFIQSGIVAAGSERILRAVLQRPHHHPVALGTPLESDPLSVKCRYCRSVSRSNWSFALVAPCLAYLGTEWPSNPPGSEYSLCLQELEFETAG